MLSDQQCPIPANEPQRLRAVLSYEILDTPPELEFDALTRVAAHSFATPIAVVAMMDSDRLWFKSKLGLTVPELDRRIAFCAHAIMSPTEPLVVQDLHNDQRFASNPLVANAPHLRFYAGAPIVDGQGNALGTIAVIDTEPRQFTEAQRHTVCDFATLVMTALDGRKRALELMRLATTDYLTGIANRAQFDMTNASEMGHSIRSGNPYSVLCMDLNGFKDVNDLYGHAAGDVVLREVADRMANLTRSGDLVARLGGDEFAVIARDSAYDDALVLAQRFITAIQQPIMVAADLKITVGVSLGISTSSPACTSAAALLDAADRALYKKKGRPASMRT
jgi:diguanylate cyclase (GGDEF)-like protein